MGKRLRAGRTHRAAERPQIVMQPSRRWLEWLLEIIEVIDYACKYLNMSTLKICIFSLLHFNLDTRQSTWF